MENCNDVENIEIRQSSKNYVLNIKSNNADSSIIVQNSFIGNIGLENNNSNVKMNDPKQKETSTFYDFGKQICENKPILNYDSIKLVRSDCKDMMKKVDSKRKLMDEYDSEVDEIDDIIDLIKETLVLCEKHKNQEVFDSKETINISISYYKCKKKFNQLISVKGWE
ncbi:hypothetical protein [Clostridium sp. UBA5712]|uniref:hypothetical protein n=1 Tax=Clostridium sp. UBA5712 TaxID=1946368 RepID=UPI003216467F